jgi:hypothetical protein
VFKEFLIDSPVHELHVTVGRMPLQNRDCGGRPPGGRLPTFPPQGVEGERIGMGSVLLRAAGWLTGVR